LKNWKRLADLHLPYFSMNSVGQSSKEGIQLVNKTELNYITIQNMKMQVELKSSDEFTQSARKINY
jgi:hypothetical protein